ncbi:MAG: RnfABCDGE type electron transport complex subunit B [Tatlockia sp.]|nr:RnfABCDGE type electron transport complex subunit B [Tatlockia sp.]
MVSVKVIDALLPQTQCGECSYAGCLPYAEALAQGSAAIDRCAPGGIETVKALAELLSIDAKVYLSAESIKTRPPALAIIREEECIGCTKCIQACPVDAIVGSAKSMHSIINTECTGCGLCLEPCPVDCIEILSVPESSYDKTSARNRYNARLARLSGEEQEKQQLYREKRRSSVKTNDVLQDIKEKQDYIQQALARVKMKKI